MKKLMIVLIIMATIIHAEKRAAVVTNVIGNGVSVVLNGVLNGHIKDFKSGVKSFIYGSVAGYGFYQSKKFMADNKLTVGVMLAQLSSSVTENVSRGYSPLEYLRYSIGFARVGVPLNGKKVQFDVSPREMLNGILMLKYKGKLSFKYGMLLFENCKMENEWGATRGLWVGTKYDSILNHEAIHYVQNLQMQSLAVYEPYLNKGFRLDIMGTLGDLANMLKEYPSGWKEWEAYGFTN